MPPYVCTHCKRRDCGNCVDIVRIAVEMGTICKCTRKQHSGEPILQQVRDPFDGSVHGPEVTVTEEGETIFLEPWGYEDGRGGTGYHHPGTSADGSLS